MEIKINCNPVNEGSPFLWEVELLSETDYLNQTYDQVTEKRAMFTPIFKSNNIDSEVINCLNDNIDGFDQLYQYRFWKVFDTVKEWYDYNISKQISFNKDTSGMIMLPHVDNRVVFGTMIINLQDNGCGTNFPQFEYTMSQYKNKGVFFLNHDITQHEIHHLEPYDRYTFAITFYLKQLTKQ